MDSMTFGFQFIFSHLCRRILPHLILLVSIVSCDNSSEFNSGYPKGSSKNNRDGTGEGELIRNVFLRKKVRGKVDLTWLLDTSASMSNETAHVKANLNSFVQSLAGQTDVKVNLVAASPFLDSIVGYLGEQVTPVSLPVASTDALKIHIAGLSKRMIPVRADARQIVVVVSDDNAIAVNSTNYLSQVRPILGNQNPVLFGFVGVGQSQCNISREGTEYQKLADTTGGKIYDICAVDWSNYFALLSESVTSLVGVELQLESEPGIESEVLRVLVGDRELPAGTYEVDNGRIRITSDKFKPDDSEEIVVETRKTRK